jgi:hypothetical protein
MTRPKKAKALLIVKEVATGLTQPQVDALEAAITFHGTTESQYCRRGTVQLLVTEGFLENPMKQLMAAKAAAAELK